MKKNYRSASEIEEELKHLDLWNFLDFDDNEKYEFARWECCFDPLLGHMEAKYNGKEGVRYTSEAVKSFGIWLKEYQGL